MSARPSENTEEVHACMYCFSDLEDLQTPVSESVLMIK